MTVYRCCSVRENKELACFKLVPQLQMSLQMDKKYTSFFNKYKSKLGQIAVRNKILQEVQYKIIFNQLNT